MGVYEEEEEGKASPPAAEAPSVAAGLVHASTVSPSKTSPGSGGARKNKRKSLEPRRFNLEHCEAKRRRRLNSTGSEENSTGSEERSPENPANSRSPSPAFKKSPVKQDSTTSVEQTAPQHLAPKKRFKLDALREIKRLEEKEEEAREASSSPNPANPFRPWRGRQPGDSVVSPPPHPPPGLLPQVSSCIPLLLQGLQGEVPLAALVPGLAGYPLLFPIHPPLQPPVQDEPLSLVKEKKEEPVDVKPVIKDVAKCATKAKAKTLDASSHHRSIKLKQEPASPEEAEAGLSPEEKAKQRNYKNLTRARRVEANARERQRVHTITAAFDTLQAAIPTGEENVKLSKLSVIKIATAYIMALSRMAGHDYTVDQSAPPVQAVLEQCRQTIEAESKVKKRS